VTDSNAHLLSGELGSSLTGRHHTVELFPFNLE
jgi:predicted AAA+ superfamily ATPase